MTARRRMSRTPEDRFHAKVVMGPDGCHIWTGGCDPTGYGRFSIIGRGMVYAHRWAFEHFVGPIPLGLDIDHLCHNRALSCPGGWLCLHRRCVRRDHLEPATRSQNCGRSQRTARREARQKAGAA